MTTPTDTTSLDTTTANVIARAERRGAMLSRLAEVGMALVEEIAQRWITGPYHPEPHHEPGRAYAVVSRAVRLTLLLEARVDTHILALRKGEAALAEKPRALVAAVRPSPTPCPSARDPGRGGDPVREAIDRETGDPWEAGWGPRASIERLIDEALSEAPGADNFRSRVEAIRSDLGLPPDASLWAEDEDLEADGREAVPAGTPLGAPISGPAGPCADGGSEAGLADVPPTLHRRE